MENYKVVVDNVIVEIDYYTELLGAIASVCDDQYAIYNLGREYNNRVYHRLIRNSFDRVNMLQAVKLLVKLSDEYYFYNKSVVRLFLMLSNNQKIDRLDVCNMSEEIEEELFEQFLESIYKFESASNYHSFYRRYGKAYLDVLEQFSKDYRIYNPISYICDLLRLENNKQVHIILMLGITNNNYRIDIDDKIYICLRPVKESNKNRSPYFTYNKVNWTTLIISKFVENYIFDIVDQYSYLLEDIDGSIYQKVLEEVCGTSDIFYYVSETIIKAIECLYVAKEFPEEFDDYIEMCNKQGYYKIRDIYKLYSNNINKNLEEFISEIIGEF